MRISSSLVPHSWAALARLPSAPSHHVAQLLTTRDSGFPPHHMACLLPPSLSLSVATRPTPACRPVTEPVFAPPWGGCLADPPGVPVLVGARTLSSPPLRVYRLEGDVYISRLARPLHLPGWRSRYISRLARPLHLEGDEADLADARGGEADHRGDEGQARPEGRQVDLPRHQRQVEPAEGED